MAGGSSSLLRRSGVLFGLAAIALVLSAPAGGATPKPEPTPEAKAVPKPEPAPSARMPSAPRAVRVVPRQTVPRRSARVAPPAVPQPPTTSRKRKAAAQTAVPRRRSPARSRRGAPPAAQTQLAVFRWREPLNPPLSFVSAPIGFSEEHTGITLLAAVALMALLAASASHLGLIYTVWRRVPG